MSSIAKLKVAILATFIIAPIGVLLIWILSQTNEPYLFVLTGFGAGLFGKIIIHYLLNHLTH